jgi:retron-type reverse transcriptase
MGGPSAWGLGEGLTTSPRKTNNMLRNSHETRCFIWRQKNPEIKYSRNRISVGGEGVLEEVARSKKRKREILLGTWNIRSLYREGSLTAAAGELARYKLDLMGV